MAAAVQEALRLQLTDGLPWHARLSQARQAMLLLDLDVDAGKIASNDLADVMRDALPSARREETSWGPGWRLPLPYDISGVEAGWHIPAHHLRRD